MSIDIHFAKYQNSTTFPLTIKTERQVLAEREDFTRSNSSCEFITAIYEIIRNIKDPEHPYTLEQLNVVNLHDIEVKDKGSKKHVNVYWKPSVPTCGFATQIGLAILLKLEKNLEGVANIKLNILIKSGTHKQKKTIDKQLNDKERITAAKENETLMNFIEGLIS